MREAELRTLLMLRAVPGVGDVRLTSLLRSGGSAGGAWKRLEEERPEAVQRAKTPAVRSRVDHAVRSVLNAADIVTVAAHQAGYPSVLFDLHDPPPLVFMRGEVGLLGAAAAAIVGTRACTEYGADAARSIADALVRSGAVVVSGLAHGIDRHAHEAALDAGGSTIAVVGCGIDVVYPRQHERLHERIGRHGLLISEFLPGEPALPHHFPRRNRIIAALSRAVVVVEAPARSGALITAEHALDLGREVLAVPGPIGRRTSAGTNALIRDGATVVTVPEDVTRALAGLPARDGGGESGGHAGAAEPGWAGRSSVAHPAAGTAAGTRERVEGPAAQVQHALTDEPLHVDELAGAAGLGSAPTLAALLELELRGLALVCAGGRYRRSPAA